MHASRIKVFSAVTVALAALAILLAAFGKYVVHHRFTVFHPLSAIAVEKAAQDLPEQPAAPGAVHIPIFIYHSVRPYDPHDSKIQREYEITPEVFEEQLQYLRDHGYTAISLDQATESIRRGTTAPIEKPVVLTFDDGWENQYRYAFPLLKKYAFTATFYIYTNPIGKKHFLTWDQVREMDRAGMAIGDHTLSHPYFRLLPQSAVLREIIESRRIIEEEIGKPVMHFASPFGYTDPTIERLVRMAGYQTERTTYRGAYQDNAFHLRGYLVDGNMDDFVAQLTE